ncbi:MAG: CsiV family protein [bacterium]|nr:CsiV family protein [bacterium]
MHYHHFFTGKTIVTVYVLLRADGYNNEKQPRSAMYQLFILISLLYSSSTLAQEHYQIDLILFSHQHNNNSNNEGGVNYPLLPINPNIISLNNDTTKTKGINTMLPPSQSALNNEYYALNHKSTYQVLGRYSWRQNKTKQVRLNLPYLEHKGWRIQSVMHIQQHNGYYLFDARLQCSSPSKSTNSFTVVQKQRLKEDAVYYLDHDQIGLLVKIYKIA